MADLNNITPMKGLPPFLQYFRTIGIIPASYKVTMTYEEQVLELMRYIKDEVIPKINDNVLATQELQEKFVELVEYVDHYFDDLDIQEEINEKLNEMLEDGTLEAIINQQIFGELDERVTENTNNINLLKDFPTTQIGLKRLFRFLETSNYYSMQGGSITPNNTLLCSMWDSSNDTNKIMEISLATGEILKQATFSYGWCNSLTFDDVHNLVYVAKRGIGTNTYLNEVVVLDYTDLSEITTLTFSDYVQSVYFDKVSSKLYFMNEWANRSINGLKIFEINQTSYAIENTITIDYSSINDLRLQNFAINNGFIYLVSSEPRGLIVFDMEGNIIKKYNLPEYISKMYYSGEYQFLDFNDNNFYIGSGDNVSGITESINQIFKITLDNEEIEGNQNENTVHAGSSYTVYVDATSTSLNPDGSQNNKFKSINEATRYQTTNRGCNIEIADGTYNGVYLRSRDHINFNGNSQNVIIKGFNINYCTHVSINNATIRDLQFDQSGVINILNSTVYLKGLNIIDTNQKYGINVGEFSQCNLSISISITTNNANQIYVRNDSLLILNNANWKIQKHQKASKIIGNGKMRMFENPSNMSIGEFAIDSSWAYTDYEFSNYFNYIYLQYKVGNNEYIKKAPLYSSSSGAWIEFTNVSGGAGTQKTSQVFYSIDKSNAKFKLQYSRVYTRNASGTSTAEVNEDNDNPINDAVIINDVWFE